MEANRPVAEWSRAGFETTHWSVVLAATASAETKADALENLCRTYWPPVYAYVRRRGRSPHEAQDLAQSFFASLLLRSALVNVRPERGKFRSFLLVSVNHFLANAYNHDQAARRGGGQPILSLDEITAEAGALPKLESAADPELALDRRWALTVLNQALKKLKAEFAAAGREAVFEQLKRFLEEEVRPGDYVSMASGLRMSSGAAAVAVHRFRQRYRELVRREIAQTLGSPHEVDQEVRYLLTVLSAPEPL